MAELALKPRPRALGSWEEALGPVTSGARHYSRVLCEQFFVSVPVAEEPCLPLFRRTGTEGQGQFRNDGCLDSVSLSN